MSQLEALIQTLCPDGVEYRRLGDVSSIVRGVTYSKSAELNSIKGYKILRANNITLASNSVNFFDVRVISDSVTVNPDQKLKMNDIFICTASGSKDHIGKVAYIDDDLDYYFGGFMAVIRTKQTLLSRFLFHLLIGLSFSTYLENTLNSSTINNLNSTILGGFRVPIPPLPVQEEIVRILDAFTNVVAELEAELAARVRQYEHYRKLLFVMVKEGNCASFSDQKASFTPKDVTIGEICRKISSGGTPNSSNREYYSGNIPWLRTQEVNYMEIVDTDIKITEQGLMNSSANWIPSNCVIVAMYGASAARVAINKIPLTTNQACCNLEVDNNSAHYKYVYHWLASQYEELKSLSEGAQPNLNGQKIRNYPIPLPPLELQEKLVAILDRFETLVNDLKNGLPAEIALRRKQYEYYRDKLLTFKEKPV